MESMPWLTKMRRRRTHGLFVEGLQYRTVESGAFGDFQDALRRHRAFRLDPDVRDWPAGPCCAGLSPART